MASENNPEALEELEYSSSGCSSRQELDREETANPSEVTKQPDEPVYKLNWSVRDNLMANLN